MKEPLDEKAQALKTALQMEIDGKEFYQKSGAQSSNLLVRKLFQHLAEQEDIHYGVIKEIYQRVTTKQAWPGKETPFARDKSLRSVFSQAIEGLGKNSKATPSEIETVKIAMQMEDQSYSFYRSRSEEADSPVEKAFYQALTAEERNHYLTLVDSHDYLSDPAGWFTKTEHWGLDGG